MSLSEKFHESSVIAFHGLSLGHMSICDLSTYSNTESV